MGCGLGAKKGVLHGPHNGHMGTKIHGTRGMGRSRYGVKGNGTWRKRQVSARWDRGNQLPWSGEPWANHGEHGQRKSGECPELRDGCELSVGLTVDPEVRGSMA